MSPWTSENVSVLVNNSNIALIWILWIYSVTQFSLISWVPLTCELTSRQIMKTMCSSSLVTLNIKNIHKILPPQQKIDKILLSQIQMNSSKLLVMKINLLLHVPYYDVIVIYTYLWHAYQTLMLKEFPPFDCLMHIFFFLLWQDMKKFGGPNKIRQKCRLRQCLNFVSELFTQNL